MREQFQAHVFVVEYPGYGICPGAPCTAPGVVENAFTAFRFINEIIGWPHHDIIVFGRSIGCGPAISLAVEYNVFGLVLVSPMLSVREFMRDVTGPLANLVEERFPNWENMRSVRSPLLIVHGQQDTLVRCRHGVELYKASSSRKCLVCPKEMGHNTNLLEDPTFFVLPMLNFFAFPDYVFEEIQVPEWAFDKRLSTAWRPPPKEPRGRQQVRRPTDEEDTSEDYSVHNLAEETSVTPIQPTFGCCACSPYCGLFTPQNPQEAGCGVEKDIIKSPVTARKKHAGDRIPVAEVPRGWPRVHRLRASESMPSFEPLPSLDSLTNHLSHQDFVDICEDLVRNRASAPMDMNLCTTNN